MAYLRSIVQLIAIKIFNHWTAIKQPFYFIILFYFFCRLRGQSVPPLVSGSSGCQTCVVRSVLCCMETTLLCPPLPPPWSSSDSGTRATASSQRSTGETLTSPSLWTQVPLVFILQHLVSTKHSYWLKQLSSRDDNHDNRTPVKRLERGSLRASLSESLPLHQPASLTAVLISALVTELLV